MKASKPSWNIKDGNVGLGSVKATAIAGGWENADVYLLDFGTVNSPVI